MTHDPKWKALCLVDADRSSTAAAAERHGVSTSTIVKWRRELTVDPELAGHYADETARAMNRYRVDFSATLSVALAKLRELIPACDIGDLPVLLNVARECGELLVQADALVPQKDPASLADREPAPRGADRRH